MTDYQMDRANGRGYAGFEFSATVRHGKGWRRVVMLVPLEVVLEFAAAWAVCPTASAGHVAWHFERGRLEPCGKGGQSEDDARRIAQLRQKLALWKPKKPAKIRRKP